MFFVGIGTALESFKPEGSDVRKFVAGKILAVAADKLHILTRLSPLSGTLPNWKTESYVTWEQSHEVDGVLAPHPCLKTFRGSAVATWEREAQKCWTRG